MSKLDELINKYCPEGVEYKKLDDICNTNSGEFLHQSKFKEGNYPVYNGGMKPAGYHNAYNRDLECVGMTLRGMSGYSNYIKGKFWAGNSLLVIYSKDIEELSNKFLYFYLKSIGEQLNREAKSQKSILSPIKICDIRNLEIPIPPIEVQNYIVGILEPLEQYTAELTAELTARKLQYKSILQMMMSNAPSSITIEDIMTNYVRGTGITKKEITEEGDPCIRYSELHKEQAMGIDTITTFTPAKKNGKWSDYGDLMIAGASETLEGLGDGKVNLYGKCRISAPIINISHKENPLYVGYAYEFARKQMQKGAPYNVQIFNCYIDDVKKVEIPYYQKNDQKDIANKLSILDQLTNNITQGLPKAIELSKKQYERCLDIVMNKLTNKVEGESK